MASLSSNTIPFQFRNPRTASRKSSSPHVVVLSNLASSSDDSSKSTLRISADSSPKARFVARRTESVSVRELQRPLTEYMSLPASQYSVLDAERIERVDDNTFRCYVYRFKFFAFEVCPVLLVRVEEQPHGCCIKLLSCKLEGSPIVVAQNDKFDEPELPGGDVGNVFKEAWKGEGVNGVSGGVCNRSGRPEFTIPVRTGRPEFWKLLDRILDRDQKFRPGQSRFGPFCFFGKPVQFRPGPENYGFGPDRNPENPIFMDRRPDRNITGPYRHAASMENKISCDSTGDNSTVQKLTSDAVIEVSIEIPFAFRAIPAQTIQSAGSQVLERVLKAMLPRFLSQLVKDYEAWASGDTSRQPLGTGEI
ncbi:hypothetical protein PHJA_002547700 [Phtheirospermum japonicum]|uniref:Uncharacterized protein n=1 Tax=Phtheirospermum japonicum TaxID=374723 RepID=A0A830CTZ1_9LAMI|nr:hypothetical protein PHJA_002547700 [Phtheirospermum japonicum]